MNNLTKRTVVAFKNHQTNKHEVALIQNLDNVNIAEVFCKWVETQHDGLKRMFDFEELGIWILNVVEDAFPRFENKDIYSHYDEVMVANINRVGLMVSKGKANNDDIIICNDDVTVYKIILSLWNITSGDMEDFSMVFVGADDIKLLDWIGGLVE